MYGWETPKERTLKFLKISPRAKMEWLREMNEFITKTSSKKLLKIRRRLRELRNHS